jgi:hypothetical protein
MREWTRKCCRDRERITASSRTEALSSLAPSYLSVGPWACPGGDGDLGQSGARGGLRHEVSLHEKREGKRKERSVGKAAGNDCDFITSAALAAEFGLGTADIKSTYIDSTTVLSIPTL